jgi:hypothetical protein
LRDFAEASASNKGLSVEDQLLALETDDDLSTDEYFQRIEDNLREGQLQLIFFS